MNCPVCKDPRSRVLRTDGPDSEKIPIDLRGLNIERRQRICSACAKTYFTLEMLEDEFNLLKKPKVLISKSQGLRP